jgi:hypothetical protein
LSHVTSVWPAVHCGTASYRIVFDTTESVLLFTHA